MISQQEAQEAAQYTHTNILLNMAVNRAYEELDNGCRASKLGYFNFVISLEFDDVAKVRMTGEHHGFDYAVVRYILWNDMVRLPSPVVRQFYKLLAEEMVDEYNRERKNRRS